MTNMRLDKDSPIPIYFQLQEWLIEQIEQGVFKPNDKIPTEEEFVQMTGLARATIRQAVQNLVNMGYLVRKKRLGTFVITREVDTVKRPIVGILLPDIRTGYAPEFARGAEDEAAKSKYSLILCNTDDLFVNADFHVARLIENFISGVILVPTAASDEKNRVLIEKFERKDIPVVLVDRSVPDVAADYVTTDNFDGAYELTKYLVLKGHKRIAITLSTLFSTERLKLEGYKKALADLDIPLDPSLIAINDGPYIEKHYAQDARTLLNRKKNYSAIFAGDDRIAFIIYSVAQQMGVSIPSDVSLAGYGDLPFANMWLTTMHQPFYKMGQECMNIIMSRIRGEIKEPQEIVLRSHLVERSSVLPLD